MVGKKPAWRKWLMALFATVVGVCGYLDRRGFADTSALMAFVGLGIVFLMFFLERRDRRLDKNNSGSTGGST